jgi:hypothetical protein
MSFNHSARTDIYWTRYDAAKFGFLGRGCAQRTIADGNRLTTAIHTNQLRLANESVLYSLDSDSPVEDRVSVAIIRKAELLKLYIT